MPAFFPVAPAKASSSDNIFSGRLDGQDSSQSAPPLLQSLTSVLIVNMEKGGGRVNPGRMRGRNPEDRGLEEINQPLEGKPGRADRKRSDMRLHFQIRTARCARIPSQPY